MFIPTIQSQGTEAQKARLLPMIKRLEIIGTYAQTEMGHGNVIFYFIIRQAVFYNNNCGVVL